MILKSRNVDDWTSLIAFDDVRQANLACVVLLPRFCQTLAPTSFVYLLVIDVWLSTWILVVRTGTVSH